VTVNPRASGVNGVAAYEESLIENLLDDVIPALPG
jgi:hypothetical protein